MESWRAGGKGLEADHTRIEMDSCHAEADWDFVSASATATACTGHAARRTAPSSPAGHLHCSGRNSPPLSALENGAPVMARACSKRVLSANPCSSPKRESLMFSSHLFVPQLRGAPRHEQQSGCDKSIPEMQGQHTAKETVRPTPRSARRYWLRLSDKEHSQHPPSPLPVSLEAP